MSRIQFHFKCKQVVALERPKFYDLVISNRKWTFGNISSRASKVRVANFFTTPKTVQSGVIKLSLEYLLDDLHLLQWNLEQPNGLFPPMRWHRPGGFLDNMESGIVHLYWMEKRLYPRFPMGGMFVKYSPPSMVFKRPVIPRPALPLHRLARASSSADPALFRATELN